MKEPKLSDLKINWKETKIIRELAKKPSKIKITINIDEETLKELKELADETGASYQKLLNQILKDGIRGKAHIESRVEKLERELAKIKKKLAA